MVQHVFFICVWGLHFYVHLISLHFLRLCFVKQELNLGSWHGRKCRDISSIFLVLGLFDTNFTNESCLREKLEKIARYWRYIADISVMPDISKSKSVKVTIMQKNEKKQKNKKKSFWPIYQSISRSIYRRYIGHISAKMLIFREIFQKKTIFKMGVSL